MHFRLDGQLSPVKVEEAVERVTKITRTVISSWSNALYEGKLDASGHHILSVHIP